MFIETVKTPGVAHLSYVVGSQGVACVIDPRRDTDVYLDIATQQGCRITHIFETHRNEDLVSGSAPLSQRTGAAVYHGPNADGEVEFATVTEEGQRFDIGQLSLEVLETPGHTKDSISFLLFDRAYQQGPVAVFTGDALFVGDVGRTDFYPDEARHVAGLLYDSLQKIRQRAGSAQLYPAHGAGSVCGDGMAEREFSTVAHEWDNNPALQWDRDTFIEKKTREFHYRPPYFALMEKLNLTGPDTLPDSAALTKLDYQQLQDKQSALKIDIRGVDAFRSGFIPGSLCLPTGLISAYAGWLLDPQDEFVLITDSPVTAHNAQLEFARIGYDNCVGYLPLSMPEHAAQGRPYDSLEVVNTQDVEQRLRSGQNWHLLDVRKKTEVAKAQIEQSTHIYLGHLPSKWQSLDKGQKITVMCASGKRATVAASWLRLHGFAHLDVYLGSMSAWQKQH